VNNQTETIIAIIADVLDMTPAQLAADTDGADIPAWDSFGHVRIVLAVEAEFGIALTMAEIERSASVPGLVAAVKAGQQRAA
jgi:acyl carrier protein